jgi:hypothetical protein
LRPLTLDAGGTALAAIRFAFAAVVTVAFDAGGTALAAIRLRSRSLSAFSRRFSIAPWALFVLRSRRGRRPYRRDQNHQDGNHFPVQLFSHGMTSRLTQDLLFRRASHRIDLPVIFAR